MKGSSWKNNPRMIAAEIIDNVLSKQRSLAECANPLLDQLQDSRDRGLAQELSYGVLRWYYQLDALISPLLKRPLKPRDSILHALLLVGAYQIFYLRTPKHAAVSSTVEGARLSGRPWATKLLNGILRNLIRQGDDLQTMAKKSPQAEYSHPQWMIDKLQKDWPNDWQKILTQNNQTARISLRVNERQNNRDDYLQILAEQGIENQAASHCPEGIILSHSINPVMLPGFKQGHVSVQDLAAQLAVPLLDLKPSLSVLDACAAPGGKTAHILESTADLNRLIAIDMGEKRLSLLESTLQRLDLLDNNVTLINQDACAVDQWWDEKPFDRILLDAPCSATGVIRRHPDIKLHRRASDIVSLAKTQRRILSQLWPLLASGGRLVYVTCSIFKQENQDQIDWFLAENKNASELKIAADWGNTMPFGRQIFPADEEMDGFYYACLVKK